MNITVKRILGTLALMALSGSMILLCEQLARFAGRLGPAKMEYGDYFAVQIFTFLAIALALCLITPWRCGFTAGSNWRSFGPQVALVFVLPPFLVLAVYATVTERPFFGMPWVSWLFGSIAQEFLFTGFVYARLCELYGNPGEERSDAFHPALLLTAFCFMLWHWPNVRYLSSSFMAFQFLYTFLGGWWALQMRRWTGSILPGIANHVLVNWLASMS